MSSLTPEIQSQVEVYTTEDIVGRELPFSVVIAMHDGTHASKPSGVVPYNTEATCSIERQVAEREITLGMFVGQQLTNRRLVAHRQG